MGTGGKLADAYANLIRVMWSESYNFLSPVTFRVSCLLLLLLLLLNHFFIIGHFKLKIPLLYFLLYRMPLFDFHRNLKAASNTILKSF
jgi:hypothetical protein